MVANSLGSVVDTMKRCQGWFEGELCAVGPYTMWFSLVCQGCEWDHKKSILDSGEMLERESLYTSIPGSDKAVRYDIWSNIHYGYVGIEAGFSEEELRLRADGADIVDNQSTQGADQIAIQIGIALRKRYKPSEVKQEHIVEAIENNLPGLLATGGAKDCPSWPLYC